ncbi:MAG TPA: hypothetical protein PLX90_12240 [Anaerolineales bacterium]|nr:hypothetical protein [Anaerolineales bacterium]
MPNTIDNNEIIEDDENAEDVSIEVGGNIKSSNISIAGQTVYFHNVVSLADLGDKELQVAYKQLLEKIDQYFDLVAETLHDNPSLQEEMLKRLQEAKAILRDKTNEPDWTLSRAQFEVRRVHVAISREQQIQNGEKRLRWIIPVLVIVYIALIVTIILLGGNVWSDTTTIPLIGVPASILIWSAIGSLAAILYRFYTRQRTRISDEIRWLIARPIIGIIMGALAYLAILSGLFIFGTAAGVETTGDARPQLLWMVAFLGGFSDKFFESIINAIVGKLSNQQTTTSTSTNTSIG